MTKIIPSVHPARAAIAAVLALGSTPLMAQTIDQSAPPPVTATQPVQAAPAAPAPVADPAMTAPPAAVTPPAPVMAPPSPVVQPIPQPTAAPAVEEAAPVERAAPAPRAVKPAARPVTKTAATPAEVAPVAAAAPAAPARPAPIADPAPLREAAPAAPSAADPATAFPANDATLQWSLAGGALLLFGGIAASFALRRRRPAEEFVQDEPLYAPEVTASAPQAAVVPASMAAPVTERESVRPVIQSAVAAPAGSLEEMVARAPSPDNPFLTRKNRLRRAAFLMEHGGMAKVQAPAASVATPAPVQKPREAPVYDFGRMDKPRRRGFFPATT